MPDTAPSFADAICAPETKTTRRCAVSGDVVSRRILLRFVKGPQSQLVPDLTARLPGRGVWIRANRDTLRQAIRKNVFARAFGGPVEISPQLETELETLLASRLGTLLSMARKAGWLIFGFEATSSAVKHKPPALLIIAHDGPENTRAKMSRLWENTYDSTPRILSCLSATELGMALQRERVIYGAIKPSPLATRILDEANRLEGFRDMRNDTGKESKS